MLNRCIVLNEFTRTGFNVQNKFFSILYTAFFIIQQLGIIGTLLLLKQVKYLNNDIGCTEFTSEVFHLGVLHFVQELIVELCYQPTVTDTFRNT